MRPRLVLASLCLFCVSVYAAPSEAVPTALPVHLVAFHDEPIQSHGSTSEPESPEHLWAATVWYLTVAENNAAAEAAAAAAEEKKQRSSSGVRASGSTAACIGRVENGGDYGRSSNPTHFGKYQYSYETWIRHGGNPEDWGTASPEEQERVFAEGTAKYGYGDWTPYDSC